MTEAIANYQKSVELAPQFYEAYEQLVHLFLQKKDWQNLLKTLELTGGNLQDLTAKALLAEATQRLREGVRHAAG